MFRNIVGVVVLLGLLAGAAAAGEQPAAAESGLTGWLKELRKKIDLVVPRKTLPVSTGVAGVRGAKDDAKTDKLYWKGKKGDAAVTEEEMKEFKEAVELVEKHDRKDALKELEAFMKQYPDSALIPDAKKTLDMLRTAEKEEKKP